MLADADGYDFICDWLSQRCGISYSERNVTC